MFKFILFFLLETYVESKIRSLELQFCKLQADTEQELVGQNETVETVTTILRGLPQRIYKDYNKYVMRLSRPSRKLETLEELFAYLNKYCWNCFEYELLEFVVNAMNCSIILTNRMNDYGREVKIFKDKTTISLFMKYGRQFFIRKKIPRSYNKSMLRTIHDINPDEHTLSYLDHFQERIWKTDLKLSECVLQIYNLKDGCVEVEWIVPEEFDYDLITFFCTEIGRELLEHHHITKIFLNDALIDHSVCNSVIATSIALILLYDIRILYHVYMPA